MRIAIVTGSRDWPSYEDIFHALNQYGADTMFHGGCPTGADKFAEIFALNNKLVTYIFKADWQIHGRAAGPIRNAKMIARAVDFKDHGNEVKVFAFRLNKSKGTSDCIRQAYMHGLDVQVMDMVSSGKT